MLLLLVCLAVTSTVLSYDLGENNLYLNYQGEYAHTYDNYKPRDYKFEYGVSDPHTGDHKSQWEVKEQGVVRGSYSLLEADGTTRVVDYIADDHGFRAIVKKIDQHGNAHVESHGGADEHEQHGHVVAQAPVISEVPYEAAAPAPVYSSYSGHVNDYTQHIEPAIEGKIALPQLTEYEHNVQPVHVTPSYDVPQQVYVQQPIHNLEHQQIAEQPEYQSQQILLESKQPIYNQQVVVAKAQPVAQYVANPQPISYEANLYQQAQDHQNVYVQKAQPQYESVGIPQAIGIYAQPQVLDKQYSQVISPESVSQYHQALSGGQGSYSQEAPQQVYVQKQNAYPESAEYSAFIPNQYLQSQTIHPHGESSQNFHSSTGNAHDDSEYTNYHDQGYQGQYSQQRIIAIPYKSVQQLPLKYVTSHPILH